MGEPKMRNILLFLVLSLGVSYVSAEESPSPSASPSTKVDQLIQGLSSRIDQLTQTIPSQEEIQTTTKEELNKIHAFEYKVVEYPVTISASELEKSLTALGAERWECDGSLWQGLQYRFVCRRHPATYLRYLPRMFP